MSDQPARFEQILTEITGLRTGRGAVTTEVGAVKTDLAGVKTDLAGVKTDLAGSRLTWRVKTDLAGVKADLLGVRTDLMGRMDRLQDFAHRHPRRHRREHGPRGCSRPRQCQHA